MLQLKLSKISFSADGTQLVVQDTTGNYNVDTNPTGYGTPNRAISANIILRWKLYNSKSWYVLPGWTGAAYTITTVNLGLSVTTPQLLPDGVEFVQYLGLYSKSANFTVTAGSSRVGFTGLDFTNIDYVAMGSDLATIYKIVSRGSNYLILDSCYEGSNSVEVAYDAQNADLQVLVQTYTNMQLDDLVASTSAEQLYGNRLNDVFNRLMRTFIAQARFNKTDYYGADLIMQNLFKECLTRGRNDDNC